MSNEVEELLDGLEPDPVAQNCERCGYAFGMQLGQVSRSPEPDLCVSCKIEIDAESAEFEEPEVFHCIECGRPFTGSGRLCTYCYVANKL